MHPVEHAVLDRVNLGRLIAALRERDYEVIAPTLREGSLRYGPIESDAELPIGFGDVQGPARCRLVRREDAAVFGIGMPAQSWKRFLYPPLLPLFRARQPGRSFEVVPEKDAVPRYAFLGVRACELQAIFRLDRVLLGGTYQDAAYAARRNAAFIVVVQCTQAGATCFCASMETGPRAGAGFDLALTELLEDAHRFLLQVGSARGAELLGSLPTRAASEVDEAAAARAQEEATAQQNGGLDTEGLPELLRRSYEHPHWEEVGRRCLLCGNCTMVCPTCFCVGVEDVKELVGDEVERRRSWDSCFASQFSYVHGGSVRSSPAARYRHWITHKLSTWREQFGSLGCVGCGRCITWCPAGIDIRAEAAALRREAGAR